MAPRPSRCRCRRGPSPNSWRTAALALLLGSVLVGCGEGRRLAQRLLASRTTRERYEARLDEAGLGGSALVRDWLAAGERALREAPLVALAHREEGFLDPAVPAAFAYRIRVERGQEASFSMALDGDSTTQVFLDAWRVVDSVGTLDLVAASDSGERVLTLEPRRGGDYVFRAQPELLRGGRFTVSLRAGPTLAFPVLRARDTDIGGRFGAPRDGGVREHHGIDIFARRGTPALAAADAYVSRVADGGLGGRTVWLRDRRGNGLYYAHLDSQLVREGEWVSAGDTVGLVGRTGNARRTPAHLHFGLYRRGEGPLDPQWYVRRVNAAVPRLAADTSLLGDWGRARRPLILTTAPDTRAAPRDSVPRNTPVLVLAAVGGWYRVLTPNGRTGYLPASRVERAGTPSARLRVDRETVVARRPGSARDPSQGVAFLAAGEEAAVLAASGESLLIRTPGGRVGWIKTAQAGGAAID